MSTPPAPHARPAPRRTTRAVFSLVALLLAPLSWWWSIDDPYLRASGATAWTMLAAALFLGLSAAWRDTRRWVRVVAGLELACGVFFVWAFFVLAKLPAAAAPPRAPDFTLPDQDGRPVTLAAELRAGPQLLVFFRGHW
ncbi:MAG TPA: hypothetical protein VF530_15065 [Planctomycetota bacterium]